eukprot:TRINITY_DN38095_c0_g1_i1.p1 TRINITY_DN38095_c0_g1~~TRINITY_DN38095_c0_g1_i1.p1  ORF type:complete len:359 (+),score=65.92 TRINITY_DN38095_c0_g1_i1:44-1078(+)
MGASSEGFDWTCPGEECWVRMSDGCEILRRKWQASSKALAVVHICHGMAEHSMRYGRPAELLTRQGFMVYAADHRAHGRTALRAKEQGKLHWPGHAEVQGSQDVLRRIVEDQVEMCKQELQENPGLPLIVIGHSMGSVIATHLASQDGVSEALAALVLTGCPARLPLALHAAFGPLLSVLRVIYGGQGVAPLISKLTFEKFNAKFAPNSTDDDWLNRDANEVAKYVKDPLCGFKVSVDFMASFRHALRSAGSTEVMQRLPAKLPVFVMVGGDDAAACNDVGTRSHQQVAEEFKRGGAQYEPKVVVYGGARHEIWDELCKHEMLDDLTSFLLHSVGARGPPRSKL